MGAQADQNTRQKAERVLGVEDYQVLQPEYYRARLATISSRRIASPIWDLFTVESNPGMLSLLAGKPNPTIFPFDAITLSVRSPNPHEDEEVTDLVLRGEELAAALQYNLTGGFPELVDWLRGLMKEVHSRGDNEGWRVSIGPGSQDLLYKALNALLNPGDTIIIEGPTYPGVPPILDALQCQYAIVASDKDGICASDLAHILGNWDGSKPFPKVLYTVPYGSNPTGVTASYERRVEILKLARKYDFIIIEDDPYYFLYYGALPRPPSYFTLEKQLGGELGRVLRLDSFSKIIAAGFRLGWVSGPATLVTSIERHNASSVVQPPSISQVIVLKLVNQWGISGLLTHTARVADSYRGRRDAFEACLERHLMGLAEWTRPDAPMFYWLSLHLPPSVDSQNIAVEGNSTAFVRDKTIPRGVLVLPGETAFVDGRQTARVRVSFSLLTDEEMDEAVRRLAASVKEEKDTLKV